MAGRAPGSANLTRVNAGRAPRPILRPERGLIRVGVKRAAGIVGGVIRAENYAMERGRIRGREFAGGGPALDARRVPGPAPAPFHPSAWFHAVQSLAACADVWASGFAGRSQLEATARRRTEDLIGFARTHSRFYARSLRGLPRRVASLSDVPPTNKSELMSRFDEWVCDPAVSASVVREFTADESRAGLPLLGRYAVWTTSGTTGDPGVFVHDGQALAVYDALELLRFRRGIPFAPGASWSSRERHAVVSASGGHFLGNASVRRMRALCPWLRDRLRLFSILDPLPALVRALNEFRPTWLATYPTAALLLAGEQAGGRLDIAPGELRVGGEQLTEAERRHLERSFSCVVRNDYGCSEFPPVTWECHLGAMHVNSDWCVLEPVDRRMRPTPAGSPSHTVLLTNLANRIQPIIRYDLGDSVTWLADPCNCGSPHPAIRVRGRCDETLSLSGDDGRSVSLLPLALTTVLEEQAEVFRFQLFRTNDAALELRLPPNRVESADEGRALVALNRFLVQQGAGRVRVELVRAELERGSSGKQKRIFGQPSRALTRMSAGTRRPRKP